MVLGVRRGLTPQPVHQRPDPRNGGGEPTEQEQEGEESRDEGLSLRVERLRAHAEQEERCGGDGRGPLEHLRRTVCPPDGQRRL